MEGKEKAIGAAAAKKSPSKSNKGRLQFQVRRIAKGVITGAPPYLVTVLEYLATEFLAIAAMDDVQVLDDIQRSLVEHKRTTGFLSSAAAGSPNRLCLSFTLTVPKDKAVDLYVLEEGLIYAFIMRECDRK